MWFKRSALFVGLIFVFECHSLKLTNIVPSTFPEDNVILKLRVATDVRYNILKIFNQLRSTNYELNRSIQQIQKYLRNGGSLFRSLHILPTLGYAPVRTQFKGILSALIEHSPRYLLPAINVVRNMIDIKPILQPNGGPLRMDMFKGISAQDLSNLALPNDTKPQDCCGLSPSTIGKTFTSTLLRIITQSAFIARGILNNFVGFNNKEFVAHMKPFTCNIEYPIKKKSVSELAAFFVGDRMNYSLLLNNKQLPKARSLLTLIDSDDSLVKNGLADFEIYEYSTSDDLLMAVISKLRRYQAQKGTTSEIVEDTYAHLIKKYRHAWEDPPKSARALKSLCYSMKTDQNSPKIRRLAKDVEATIEANVSPEIWSTIGSRVRHANCYGPSCTVLRTLEGIRKLGSIKDPALNTSILSLVKTYNRLYRNDTVDTCLSNFLANSSFQDSESKMVLDVDDIMQAIPGLDINSEEYINLRDFLSSKDLEKQIGEDMHAKEHPTRGRLLAWLLGKVRGLNNVDEKIQRTAKKFVKRIAHDGYGAVKVSFRRA